MSKRTAEVLASLAAISFSLLHYWSSHTAAAAAAKLAKLDMEKKEIEAELTAAAAAAAAIIFTTHRNHLPFAIFPSLFFLSLTQNERAFSDRQFTFYYAKLAFSYR